MIYNNRYCFVVRNSKSIVYRFTLNNNKNLFLQSYNYKGITSSSVFKESIINFSAGIDSLDKIHILYASADGNVKYTAYPSNFHKDINLFNFDNKVFNIPFLSLKTVGFKPHIFYILENKLQPSHKSIYHGFLENNTFHNTKIEDITFSKYIYPYIVDVENNNIYIFYSKNHNNFTLKKFDTRLQDWQTYDDNIFIPSANNANFLINDKNTALLCYNSAFNKNIQTFVKYKDLDSHNSQWSNSIMLSDGNTNSAHASIVNKNGNSYVTWEENGQIVYRKSLFGKDDWEDKKILAQKKDKFFTAIYLSNHQTDKDYKSIFTTIDMGAFPYPVINLEGNTPSSFYIDKNPSNNSLFMPINNLTSTYNRKEKKFIQELQSLLADKDKKIIELSQHNLILKNELEIKNKQLENLIKKLEKRNWFQKFFKNNS